MQVIITQYFVWHCKIHARYIETLYEHQENIEKLKTLLTLKKLIEIFSYQIKKIIDHAEQVNVPFINNQMLTVA